MRFLIRNWHIKLAAVAVSFGLYTGIVFSGSFRDETTTPGVVQIQAVNQPENTYLFADRVLSDGVVVDYRAPVQAVVGSDTFQATVDLSSYDLSRAGQRQPLAVRVSAVEGVDVRDWRPRQVAVRLDRLGARTIRVVVDAGQVPDGLELGTPQLDVETVEAQGPRTVLNEVVNAVARVRVDPSGVDVETQVALIAVDADGEPVEPIDLTPALAGVVIPVQATETNRTVPVRPVLAGAPATGYGIRAVRVEPARVTLRGAPDALVGVSEVATEPIGIEGASVTGSFAAVVALPPGARLLDEAAITVTVEVAALDGSRTLQVGVLCTGVGDGLVCTPQVGSLTVTLQGPIPALDALTPQLVTPTVSVQGLPAGRYTLDPRFSLPAGIQVLGVSPARLDVVLSPAATPTPTPG